MHDDHNFRPLEDRLAAEARRLLTDNDSGPRPPALFGESRRRDRRRRLVRKWCAAAAIAFIGLAAVTARHWRGNPNDVRAHVLSNVRPVEPEIRAGEGAAAAPAGGQAVDIATADGEPGLRPIIAIPILFGAPADGGELVYAAGWYVPEQVEPIDDLELSPAERDAVWRLLGVESETAVHEPI